MSEFDKYLAAQRHAMDKAIYLASEKARIDLHLNEQGNEAQEFFVNWINTHSKNFSEAWKHSKCRSCSRVLECHNCLKDLCDDFKQEDK